jgi:single-stranded-DNA-specific exonuclease
VSFVAEREWAFEKQDKSVAASLRTAGFSRILATLLAQRGFTDKDAVKSFLSCRSRLHEALLMKGMAAAAARIALAVHSSEKITVYGDYDADGVSATALLYSYLKEAGADVNYYIPDRENEGYGLNASAIEKISQGGTALIVTVDTGISAFNEAKLASQLGVCLIVTDHHEPRQELPEAYAIVNPKQEGCEYPYKELAGVGVAFKLVCALEKSKLSDHPSGDAATAASSVGGPEICGFLGGLDVKRLFKKYGELVCLGTVADVVPLTGENRLLVCHGLKLVSEGGNCGIAALLEVAGARGKKLTAGLLSFTVAPRINACGRLSSAYDALELLTTQEPENAAFLARKLDDNNKERREIETRIFNESVEKIKNNEALRNNPLLIVSGEGWHNGVIGIVASRLVELYGKPAIIVSFEGDIGRASCRSITGFNIHEALVSCGQHLERFGGHELAAGFTVKRENYDSLYGALIRIASAESEPPTLKVHLDMRLHGSEISLSTAREIRSLEPFGSGNPSPLFYIPAAQILALSPVGTGHKRLTLNCEGFEFTAIMFGTDKNGFDFKTSDIVDIAASLDVNLYKNNETLSVIVKNIRKSSCFDYYAGLYKTFLSGQSLEPAELRLKLTPSRDEFTAVYRYLFTGNGKISLEETCKEICRRCSRFNYFKMLLIADVFSETGLVTKSSETGADIMVYSINRDRKIELSTSILLGRLK